VTRDEAWDLLCEHTKSDSLRKHGLAVEAAMRHFAARFGEDEEVWGVTGLLHDFDYERDPEGHPQNGKPILEQAGVPGPIVHAIQSHGDHTGIPRVTAMEKTLYAVDELTGFVTAVALVRPSKAVRDVDATAVRKKMKDKAFAAKVSRQDIVAGAEGLGMPLEELIQEVILALRVEADALGLAGTGAAPVAAG
jgi:putative nucleotidyltransferase with HDIG domain